ncbi:MAG: Ig-like domain-containing protein, partial [Treponema sp.]|nr:Ig-like domain-containing protein [Treponema sp.]
MNFKKCFYSVISKSILLFSLISILIFSSCEVGLGESVDTENPSVEITYPPNGSVIRGAFTFAGLCADDKGVAKVSVTVRKNDDANFVKEYEAKILDGGKWTCILNEVQDDKSPTALQEKVFPFADGKYEIKAVAIDSSNRQSDGISRTYEIDNTPPVFIISSPVVTDTQNATEYGSIFKISGDIADDHAPLSSMKVSVFDQDGNEIPGNETWTFTKVDISGGTTVKAARYFTKSDLSQEEQILYKNYINIYGEDTEGDKVFTCTVQIEDSAHEWMEPNFNSKKEVVNKTEGNKTTKLYLKDSIHSLLMGPDSKYQVEAGEIKDILNGTTKNETVLSILNEKITDTKETKLAFSLNKKANPIYSIIGYDVDVKDLNFASHEASKNQTVGFQVQAGLNGTSVSPETFKLYLFGPFEKNALTQEEIQKIYDEPELSAKTYSEKSLCSVIFDGKDYSKGSKETFTQKVSLPQAISNEQFYVFAASGKDLDNLDLQTSNDTVYGFQGISAGTPPKVYISEPASDGLVIKENSSLVIKGIAESAESKIASVKYEIAVYDTLKSDENGKFIKVGEISGNAVSDSGFGLPVVSYSCSVKDGNVKLEDGYTSVNPGDGEIFSYEIKVTVQDDSNTESFIERNIYLDNAAPVVAITNVDPVAEKKLDEDGNIIKKINGIVTVSGKVTEKNLKTFVLTVKDKDGKTETHTYSEASFEEKIDTTLFSNGKVEFTLTAMDEAGNESSVSENYTVDQTTDKPVIKFSNGKDSSEIKNFTEVDKTKNTFGVETNNKAVFSFTDDDGLEKVTITLLDKDGTEVDASILANAVQIQENQTEENPSPVNPVVYTFDGSTTSLVNYILPKREGRYILKVEAVDVEHKNASEKIKTYRMSETTNYIAVSDSNFNIKFTGDNIINDECSTQLVETEITGIVTVSAVEKIKSIERYEITQNDEGDWVLGSLVSSYKNDATEENPNTITIKKDSSSNYVQWTEIVPQSKMEEMKEGVKNFRYVATDITDVSVSVDLKWNVDDTVPSLHWHSDTEKINDKWLNSPSQTLIYIVQDPKTKTNSYASGIDSVKYSFKNNGSDVVGYFARGASCDENGDEKAASKDWILYKTTFDLPEEKSTSVTVTVSDKVGNKKTDSINFKIDTIAPTVSVTPSIPAEQVLQNTKTIPVKFAYTDATSGIQCVEFSTDSSMKNNLVTLTGNEIVSPYEYSLSGLLDGTYTIYVRATDNAGNKTSSISAGSVTVDNTAPKVEIKTPVSGAIVNKTIDFTGTVTDNNLSKSAEPVLRYKNGDVWTPLNYAST